MKKILKNKKNFSLWDVLVWTSIIFGYFAITIGAVYALSAIDVYVLNNGPYKSFVDHHWRKLFTFVFILPAVASLLHIIYIERGFVQIKFLLWLVLMINIFAIPLIIFI